MDIQKYWKIVAEQRATLPPGDYFYLFSLDNAEKNTTPGTISQVSREKAARSLVSGAYRLATDDEIAAYLEEQKRESARITKAEFDRRTQVVVRLEEGMTVTKAVPQAAPSEDTAKSGKPGK